VVLEGPSDGAAVLVVRVGSRTPVRRSCRVARRRTIAIGKEVVSIQAGTPEEIPTTPVEVVSARLGDNVDDGAAVVAILSGEAIVDQLKFLDTLDRRLVLDIRSASLTPFG